MCNVVGIFAQGLMSVMKKLCIPVLVVTLFIALRSYAIYILIWLSDISIGSNW